MECFSFFKDLIVGFLPYNQIGQWRFDRKLAGEKDLCGLPSSVSSIESAVQYNQRLYF